MLVCKDCGKDLTLADDFFIADGVAQHTKVCTDKPPLDIPSIEDHYKHCGQCGQPVDISQRGNAVLLDGYAYCRACCIEGLDLVAEIDRSFEAGARVRGGSPRFYELLAEMGNVHAAKNSDYSRGGSDPFRNFRASERIGIAAWRGAFVRLQDKYERCVNLIGLLAETGSIEGAVKDETFADTIVDLANYSLIVRCLYEEWLRVTASPADASYSAPAKASVSNRGDFVRSKAPD